jgi:site-specific recombinase XerD
VDLNSSEWSQKRSQIFVTKSIKTNIIVLIFRHIFDMKTRFYLRKSTKSYSINFECRDAVGNIRLRTSTGYIILNSRDWDETKEKIKIPSSVFNANDINIKLSESKLEFNKMIREIGEDMISETIVQKVLNQVFKKTKEVSVSQSTSTTKNLIQYYTWFLDYYSKNNSPTTKKPVTKGTLKAYKSGLVKLQMYLDDRKIKNFSFNDCNRDFYNDYVNFLKEKNYSLNYIGGLIQKLKTILGYAYDEDLHKNNEFKKSYFSKSTEEIDHVYLNVEELKSIEQLVLNDEVLNTVRDIFLIGCNTGLRISDILSLLKKTTPVIFTEDGVSYFNIKQIKTSHIVVIPLNSNVLKIVNKRAGTLPDYLHQNVINQHIKSICKKAKIVENHTLTRTEGGKEVEYNLPKYKLVASHTARRSFCTNAYKSGMPIQDIMAISGHKSERVFLNYVKVEKTENAKRIAKHAFFS